MNYLSKRFINRHQTKLLLFVFWLHVSILDFFGIYRGPVFYFKESMRLNTLLTHALIALFTVAFSLFVMRLFSNKPDVINEDIIDTRVKIKDNAIKERCE